MSQVVENVSAVPGEHLFPGMIDPTNYATNKKVAKRVEDRIINMLPRIRSERITLNSQWERYFRIWEGTHTIKYYDGEADLRIRMARKATDTFVAHTKASIWPEDALYEVNSDSQPEKVEMIRDLIDHDIEQAELQRKLDLFLTTGFIYGWCCFKTFWKVKSTTNWRRRRRGENILTVPETIQLYEGPASEIVDPFRLYFHPITARTIDDATIVFEDISVTASFLKDMENAEVYMKVDRVFKDPMPDTKVASPIADMDAERDRRVENQGYTVTGMVREETDIHRLTEIYAAFDLYDNGRLIPCKITVVGDHILEVRQNPFFEQRAPYHMWRVTDLIDNIYGQGMMSLIEDYQYGIDALINQSIDNVNFQLNPIIYINEDLMDREQVKIRPRAVWSGTGSAREAFDIIRPPDSAQMGLQMAGVLIQMLENGVGTPPIQQGRVAKSGTTATEISQVAAGAAAIGTAQASKIQQDVMEPMMRTYYFLEEQFGSPSRHARIVNNFKQKLDQGGIQDLLGDYAIRWFVGSSEVLEQVQVRQFEGGTTATPGGGGVEDMLGQVLTGGQ